GRHGVEGEERIGGHGGVQFGAEDLLAVVGGDEGVDDVARDPLPGGRIAEAGLHPVRNKRLDRDDLAASGFGRDVDQGARHIRLSSRQAPSVMMTSTAADQNVPSDSSAMATTVWV